MSAMGADVDALGDVRQWIGNAVTLGARHVAVLGVPYPSFSLERLLAALDGDAALTSPIASRSVVEVADWTDLASVNGALASGDVVILDTYHVEQQPHFVVGRMAKAEA